MATKTKKKTQTTKTATTKKAGAKATRKTAAKATPKEDLVVFAFRLTQKERDAIHETAGPAKASRFVRQVAVAFAKEDESAFRSALKEAREARA